MADTHLATGCTVVAVQAAQQRAFATAGVAGQRQAFTGLHLQIDVGKHRQLGPCAVMQGKGFAQGNGFNYSSHSVRSQGVKTEETSSWV